LFCYLKLIILLQAKSTFQISKDILMVCENWHYKVIHRNESIPLKTTNKSTESCVIPAHAWQCCWSLSWTFTTFKSLVFKTLNHLGEKKNKYMYKYNLGRCDQQSITRVHNGKEWTNSHLILGRNVNLFGVVRGNKRRSKKKIEKQIFSKPLYFLVQWPCDHFEGFGKFWRHKSGKG